MSTAAALVAAGGGARVCKHGNRKATATSGSADTLEALGVVIDLGPAGVARCVAESGMGFCFAPRFHPGMRHAGPVRRELRVRTVFNFLGPMANPARPRGQVVGVSDPTMAGEIARVLRTNGARRAMVVFGHDGLDELTTTTASTVVELDDDEIRTYDVQPAGLGLEPVDSEDLAGGDPTANAALVRGVLDGKRGAHRDIVVLNADLLGRTRQTAEAAPDPATDERRQHDRDHGRDQRDDEERAEQRLSRVVGKPAGRRRHEGGERLTGVQDGRRGQEPAPAGLGDRAVRLEGASGERSHGAVRRLGAGVGEP